MNPAKELIGIVVKAYNAVCDYSDRRWEERQVNVGFVRMESEDGGQFYRRLRPGETGANTTIDYRVDK